MHLIPNPKKAVFGENICHKNSACLILDPSLDSRAVAEANALCLNGSDYKIKVSSQKGDGEGYKIIFKNDGGEIIGESDKGVFYALKTLKQILSQSDFIPSTNIEDAPDFAHRGFYQDITRGRVPTVSGLKKIIKRLSDLKYNSLQIYVEHTYEFSAYKGINENLGYLTADEIREVDEFAKENYIDLIPSLSTFGHLYELLQNEKYAHLCELENYSPSTHFWVERMAHHTIDVNNPDSFEVIKSLIDEFLPLFSSDYFNICCDETFDLGKGRNKGCDVGELYFGFAKKIIDHVKSYGKKVMMWGDVFLQNESAQHLLPKDVILLNWDYNATPSKENAEKLKAQGLQQIICPGTHGWKNFCDNPDNSEPNIIESALIAKDVGALGFLLTNWGDYGHICPFNNVLYSASLGASVSWNVDSAKDNLDESISKTVFGADDIVSKIRLLNSAQRLVKEGEWDGGFQQSFMDLGASYSFSKSVDEIKEQKEIALKLYGDFESADLPSEIKEDLEVSALGVYVFITIALYLKAGIGDKKECDKELSRWFEKYKSAWLRDNKQSEVDIIYDTFKSFLK